MENVGTGTAAKAARDKPPIEDERKERPKNKAYMPKNKNNQNTRREVKTKRGRDKPLIIYERKEQPKNKATINKP